jgi:hypothetical protein
MFSLYSQILQDFFLPSYLNTINVTGTERQKSTAIFVSIEFMGYKKYKHPMNPSFLHVRTIGRDVKIFYTDPSTTTKAQQPPVGQGLLIIEASQSHSDTPHSVGLLWTSNKPEAETST